MTQNETTSPAPDAQPAPADWRTEPTRWVEERRDYDPEALANAVLPILRDLPDAGPTDRFRPYFNLLRALRGRVSGPGWLRYDGGGVAGSGNLAAPTDPAGVRALSLVRDWARLEGIVLAPDSPAARVRAALDSAQGRPPVLAARDAHDPRTGTIGFELVLPFRPFEPGSSPPDLLLPYYAETEIDGDAALDLIRDEGWCDAGASEFLEARGISHDRQAYECEACGHYDEDDDENGTIVSIEDFVLSPAIIADLRERGYWDAVRDALFGSDPEKVWDRVSEDEGAALSEVLPAEDGAALPEGAIFRASYFDLPGLEDWAGREEDPAAALVRVLPALVDLVGRFLVARRLPPVPGVVTHADADWNWDPETGVLRSRLSSSADRVRVEWGTVEGGSPRLVVLGGPPREVLPLQAAAPTRWRWTTPAYPHVVGSDAAAVIAAAIGDLRL